MPQSLIGLAGALLIIAAISLGGPRLDGGPSAGEALAADRPASPANLPGPRASVKAKLRAYGKRCAPLGRRADARVKGSDFAACLDAMARLGSGRTRSPKKACRALSAKRTKGKTTSARARCIVAGRKVLRDRRLAQREPADGGPDDPAAADPSADPSDVPLDGADEPDVEEEDPVSEALDDLIDELDPDE